MMNIINSFRYPHFLLACMLIGLNVFGAEPENWGTIFDEQFEDNPYSRFDWYPVRIPGRDSAGGRAGYEKEDHAYRMGGHMKLVRPVQAGPHVELQLVLRFRPPGEDDDSEVLRTEFRFVLFDRTIVGIQLQRSKEPYVAGSVNFVKETSNQVRVIREIQLPEAPPDGDWLLRFRHGLLTLVQGTNNIGSAEVGQLGIPVAGVSWIQKGGTVVCEQMTLSGEPINGASAEGGATLREAAQLNREAQELLGNGQTDEGLIKMKEASAMFVEVRGENHHDSANSFLNLAAFQTEMGNPEEAKKLLSKALAIHEKTLGITHPHTTLTRFQLGESYLGSGDKEKAKLLWTRCRDDWSTVLGPDYLWSKRSKTFCHNFDRDAAAGAPILTLKKRVFLEYSRCMETRRTCFVGA